MAGPEARSCGRVAEEGAVTAWDLSGVAHVDSGWIYAGASSWRAHSLRWGLVSVGVRNGRHCRAKAPRPEVPTRCAALPVDPPEQRDGLEGTGQPRHARRPCAPARRSECASARRASRVDLEDEHLGRIKPDVDASQVGHRAQQQAGAHAEQHRQRHLRDEQARGQPAIARGRQLPRGCRPSVVRLESDRVPRIAGARPNTAARRPARGQR